MHHRSFSAVSFRISPFVLISVLCLCVGVPSCDSIGPAPPPVTTCTELLTQTEVQSIIAHAVEQAQRVTQKVIVAVSDREGNILGVFRMTGARLDSAPLIVSGTTVQVTTVDTCIRKARTAAFLSSNQNAFSTVTACYITRPHFPPGVANTAAGPLFGVGISSLPISDIMPNGNALNDLPGGIPIFKNGCLAGGIGVIGAASQFNSSVCTGQSFDESIALGALVDGFLVANDKRGDNIFIDGIRFLYTNATAPAGNFTLTFVNALTLGAVVRPVVGAPTQKFPSVEGYVNLDPQHNFNPIAGSPLSQADVQRIIQQAAAQAARTRAAIRRPVGAAAQVFISVVDLDGKVLGIWRTPDATIFSYDVSAQKARTALIFSNPANPINQNNIEFSSRIRSLLGLSSTDTLSMTTRAVGFLAQDFYPPGIDRDSLGNRIGAGPLFLTTNFGYQFDLLARGLPDFGSGRGNGVTIFPGGIPLYKNGQLAGAIGISGDGVDQDDLIASAGTAGFEAPSSARCDQFFYKGVRLPYVKTPRQPDIR